MSFIYPRQIAVTRQVPVTGGGVQSYSGMQPAEEANIASGLPASIQLAKERGRPEANLPSDGGRTLWKVLMPLSAIPLGTVHSRDILTDDLGVRYQVIGPYWNSLGYNMLCERLEA